LGKRRVCDDPNERALWVRIALDWLKVAEMERRADLSQKKMAAGYGKF